MKPLDRIPRRHQALRRRRPPSRGVSLHHRRRHAGDAARPLGLRQDDDAAPDRRPRAAERGPHPDRRPRRHARLGAAERDVSMVFQSYALFPHMSVLENVALRPASSGLAEAAGGRAGARRRWRRSASTGYERAPAVGAVGRPAAARRRRARAGAGAARCCCSTSRCRTSTPACAARCARRSASCSSGSASPSSTSRTTRRRRWRCPTASSS